MESAFCPAGAIKGDADFRLIETFLYHPADGFRHLDMHLRRMGLSARAFGIDFDAAAQQARLQEFHADTALRCRLTLSAEGQLELTTAALPAAAQTWTLRFAKTRLRADDPWLQHKSTRRRLYDAARANLPPGVDELLFLNEREEVCEGTITNLFVTLPTGQRVTPPRSSGLLPGVLRQQLLDRGEVIEQVVTVQDLLQAQSVTVGNALRGEIAAELLPLKPV